MKKLAYACVLLVVIAISFVCGMLFAGSKYFQPVADMENTAGIEDNKEDKEVGKINKKNVGVYQTNGWGGDETRILALYDDGTCQYPSGADGTWTSDESKIYIEIITDDKYDLNKIVGLECNFYSDTTESILNEANDYLKSLDNIESIIWDKEEKTCTINFIDSEKSRSTINLINRNVNYITFMDYKYAEGVTTSKHEAKIMKSGLVLHDVFFEKVSD